MNPLCNKMVNPGSSPPSVRSSGHTCGVFERVFTLLIVATFGFCFASPVHATDPFEPPIDEETETSAVFDHTLWQSILVNYASTNGSFDYSRLLETASDFERFNEYLEQLASARLSQYERSEQLAFWVNAYNACAVANVLSFHPLDTLTGIPEFFEGELCTVAGAPWSLNQIENTAIRHDLPGEPRINFALSCGAAGAPPLSLEAYVGSRLSAQLEVQTARFIQREVSVNESLLEVELSRIFQWFSRDFRRGGGIRDFIGQRAEPEIADNVLNDGFFVVFREFDWSLNQSQD